MNKKPSTVRRMLLAGLLPLTALAEADLAPRPIDDCRIEQGPAQNGQKPDETLVRRLITCLWERAANPGMDGAVTVDIGSLKIGSARNWVVKSDIGPADLDTRVWPVATRYTRSTHYRTRTSISEADAVFNCFVTNFGSWQCGLGQTVRSEPLRNVDR